MICYVCDMDSWHKFEDLHKGGQIICCKNCGNLCFEVEPGREEKIKQYYRGDYRGEVVPDNLLTTNRKLNYIRMFIGDYLKDRKGLICGDIGCATGYLPNWLRLNGHKAIGSEYTITFRRFSEAFYGIPLPEELPEWSYDLLVLYHVLEHMAKPDGQLIKYKKLLKDDGRFLISVPFWLDILEQADGTPFDGFEKLFHKDHINLFTRTGFRNLLNKTGFEIEKEDIINYGLSVLAKKCEPKPIEKENWEEVVKKVLDTKKASDLFFQGKFEEAIDVYPAFPDAWLKLIWEKCAKDSVRQEDLWIESLKHLDKNLKFKASYGQWLYQRRKLTEAIVVFEWTVSTRPGEEAFILLGHCYEETGDYTKAILSYYQAAQINPEKWRECNTWICHVCSGLPNYEERALEELAKAVRTQNAGKVPLPEQAAVRGDKLEAKA